jgi:hypothetical protein
VVQIGLLHKKFAGNIANRTPCVNAIKLKEVVEIITFVNLIVTVKAAKLQKVVVV